MSALTKNDHDELLDALALLDAYQRNNANDVETLTACTDPADLIHAVLMASQLVAHALATTSKHSTSDVIDALRRQLVFEREKASN